MASSSFNMEDLSPKSKVMMEYMKKLEKEIEKLGGGYVLIWWNETALQIKGMRRPSIKSWEELKREMREIFVPLYYKRHLFVKLQKMYQGCRCVKEYFKIWKAQIVESQKATMVRFLHGLNRDIQDIVELHDYTLISKIFHQASKVEHNLGGMEKSPTLPQSPTRRIRKGENRNSLEGTKFVRRGVHPSKATKKGSQNKLNKRHVNWVGFLEQFPYVII
ncbi:hypothetical protein CR513_27136, partial [Mucuna pruriens]